jgi:2-oxoglutarate ferredoxin oxidoreductase subunit alpha
MVPVIILSDGYVANGSEPWRIPEVDSLSNIDVTHPEDDGGPFLPYARNERLGRPWAIPGTSGLMHRIGGLEKEDGTGNVSYDPANHQKMTDIRQKKIDLIADDVPELEVEGPESGDMLVLSWGGTYGACVTSTRNMRAEGHSVSHAHLRYLNPFPRNLGDVLKRFKKVVIPELNMGQLAALIRAKYLVDAAKVNKVQGKPFTVNELVKAFKAEL